MWACVAVGRLPLGPRCPLGCPCGLLSLAGLGLAPAGAGRCGLASFSVGLRGRGLCALGLGCFPRLPLRVAQSGRFGRAPAGAGLYGLALIVWVCLA